MARKPKQLDIEDFTATDQRPPSANARYEAKMRAAGFAPVKLWVPEGMRAQLLELAERLRENPNLELGPLRDRVTRKLVRGVPS